MAGGSTFSEAHRLAARRAMGQTADLPQKPHQGLGEDIASVTGPLGAIIGSWWGPVGSAVGEKIGTFGGQMVGSIASDDEESAKRAVVGQIPGVASMFTGEDEDA